jgi:hypothetical protein
LQLLPILLAVPYIHLQIEVLRRPVEFALAALVGVHDDAGHGTAAHRHRHHQRTVGQLRVVVLAQRESQHPA